jgi:hypothetical protein
MDDSAPSEPQARPESQAQVALPQDAPSNVLQVHLAEYAALTTRITYWITLQFALWPIGIVFLAFVAQVWPKSDAARQHFLLWLGLVGLQLIGFVWYVAAWEQYGDVAYLETVLRPRVASILGGAKDFWTYEQSRARKLGSYLPLLAEWPIAVFSIAAVGGAAWFSAGIMKWTSSDWVGLTLSSLLGAIHLGGSVVLTLVRYGWVRSMRRSARAAEQGHEADEPRSPLPLPTSPHGSRAPEESGAGEDVAG